MCTIQYRIVYIFMTRSVSIATVEMDRSIISIKSINKITYILMTFYRWGGTDKSLAQPTFRCLRTESIVSLERGVCSCAELQVFSCYRGCKEVYQRTHAISTTLRRELSRFFFFSCNARRRRKFTPFSQKY